MSGNHRLRSLKQKCNDQKPVFPQLDPWCNFQSLSLHMTLTGSGRNVVSESLVLSHFSDGLHKLQDIKMSLSILKNSVFLCIDLVILNGKDI